MEVPNAVKIVEEFWSAVWKDRNPDAIDRFVVDDFVLTTGGVDVVSQGKFKEWVRRFLEKITDFRFEVVETFQNADGSRVAVARHGQEQRRTGYEGRPAADRVHGHGRLGRARRRETAAQLGRAQHVGIVSAVEQGVGHTDESLGRPGDSSTR
jgi:hypothetical protein